MTKKSIRALAAVLVFVSVACGKDAQQETPRQVELAPQPTAQTTLNDAPKPEAKPAPTKTAPKPAPKTVASAPTPAPTPVVTRPAAPSGATMGTVASGTAFTATPTSKICTNTHHAGDRFTTTMTSAVYGSNGVSIPAGSTVALRVIESARSEDSKDKAKLSFAVMSVIVGGETYEASGTAIAAGPYEMVRAQSTETQAKKVGAGAAIGAIAGQILGKNTKSTVIGAAVGAAAGGAVASAQNDYDACIGTATGLNVTLDRELRIKKG